jgi:PAS domain S-box-containing protein
VRAEYPDAGMLGRVIQVQGVPAEERLIATRKPLIIPDVAGDESLGPVRSGLLEAGIQSILIVPVLDKEDRLIGSFSLDMMAGARIFSPDEVDLCQVFAAHVAVAVEHAQLFAELTEANQWREALIEKTSDAVIAIDEHNKITHFNKRAQETLGWSAEEVLGQTVVQLYKDVEKAREIFGILNRGETITDWYVTCRHRNGSDIPALLSATPMRDSQGHPIGQAGFLRDLRRVELLEGRLRALIRVSQAITSILDLDHVLDQIVRLALDAFPKTSNVAIHLYEERKNALSLYP